MPSLDSDKIDRQLRGKMKAARFAAGDWYYSVSNDSGDEIASTSISKGSKQALSSGRVREMARQLRLDSAQQLADLVACPLSREQALVIMQRNYDADPHRA